MSAILWIGYIAILIWMLSPDHMHVLLKTKEGRAIVLKGAAVVTVGYLLSISCQVAVLVVLTTLGLPKVAAYFAYCLVYIVFWLLEAEAFHRLQYKFTIKNALLKKKSLLRWLAVSGVATVAVVIYNAIGGLATRYVLVEKAPGWEMFFFRMGNILLRTGLPDVFLTVCYLVLYYKTMQIVIRTAEWG